MTGYLRRKQMVIDVEWTLTGAVTVFVAHRTDFVVN